MTSLAEEPIEMLSCDTELFGFDSCLREKLASLLLLLRLLRRERGRR
jgi:hypothetical protein